MIQETGDIVIGYRSPVKQLSMEQYNVFHYIDNFKWNIKSFHWKRKNDSEQIFFLLFI